MELNFILDFVVKLGPATYGENGAYEYAVVDAPGTGAMYVLARDVESFFDNYNDEVRQFLRENDFTGFWNEPIVTYQSKYCQYPEEP